MGEEILTKFEDIDVTILFYNTKKDIEYPKTAFENYLADMDSIERILGCKKKKFLSIEDRVDVILESYGKSEVIVQYCCDNYVNWEFSQIIRTSVADGKQAQRFIEHCLNNYGGMARTGIQQKSSFEQIPFQARESREDGRVLHFITGAEHPQILWREMYNIYVVESADNKKDKELERIIDGKSDRAISINVTRKEKYIDAAAAISYSIVVGSCIDISVGLDTLGVFASRAQSALYNTVLGPLYGMYRDFVFRLTKTTDSSNKFKRWLVDTYASFVSFNAPVYAAVVAAASYLTENRVNWKKVEDGAYLVVITAPLIGPTLGWWYNRMRKWFGIETAQEKAEKYTNSQS